jgi:hypothetical protein
MGFIMIKYFSKRMWIVMREIPIPMKSGTKNGAMDPVRESPDLFISP